VTHPVVQSHGSVLCHRWFTLY